MSPLRSRSAAGRGIALLCLATLMATAPPALAESGVRLGSLEVVDGTMCPACGDDQTVVLALEIKNTNDGFLACKEDVKITKEDIRACSPAGTCTFLGFSTTSDVGSMTNSNLTFTLDEDSSKTVYFAVETGPNTASCDFLETEIEIAVCDIGGGCIWDAFDRPCEPPTLLRKTVRVKTLENSCPTSEVGTALIKGYVYDSGGDPVRNAVVRLERGCLGSDGHVGLVTTSGITSAGSGVGAGYFEFVNVPQALGYTLSALNDGVTASVTLDVTSDAITQDLNY